MITGHVPTRDVPLYQPFWRARGVLQRPSFSYRPFFFFRFANVYLACVRTCVCLWVMHAAGDR